MAPAKSHFPLHYRQPLLIASFVLRSRWIVGKAGKDADRRPMLKHVVRAALLGLRRESIIPTSRRFPGRAAAPWFVVYPSGFYWESRARVYAELVDIAERNNPATRIAWERAKQRAESLGIARSEYSPILVGIAAFGDSRQIDPFPAAIIPKGYSMVEVPFAQPEITLDYLLFDFGKREAKVAAAVAQKLGSRRSNPGRAS